MRGGNLKKSENRKREINYKIRFSKEEYFYIKDKANFLDLPIAEYIRTMLITDDKIIKNKR